MGQTHGSDDVTWTSASTLTRSSQCVCTPVSRVITNHEFKSQGLEVVTPSRLKIRALNFFPVSTLLYTKISGRSSDFSSPLPPIKRSIRKMGVRWLTVESHANEVLNNLFKSNRILAYSWIFQNSDTRCFMQVHLAFFPWKFTPPFTQSLSWTLKWWMLLSAHGFWSNTNTFKE